MILIHRKIKNISMKLKKFRIQNYCSIVDSGVIELSSVDNVSIFAGQNESGKSSLLRALRDFERNKFDQNSIPFSTEEIPIQSVSCTYEIASDDNLTEILSDAVVDDYELAVGNEQEVLDENKLKKLREFTITKTNIDSEVEATIDDNSFKYFQAAILDKPKDATSAINDKSETIKEKYIEITDEDNSEVADLFWHVGPKIVFFDDFCDLLPNKIFISALKEKEPAVKGLHAVRNLERVLQIDFMKKNEETDSVRITKESRENETLSIDFQEDWGQRIHEENQVLVKYNFQKRDGVGEAGSYINFYVETKKDQPLPPKQRSKGLIWFLSLWLELKAQDAKYNDLVLLLDEPDQHLHVKAQKDILSLINKLAKESSGKKGDQILYSTHSPHLIEVDYLSRIKLVLNTETEGTIIESLATSKIDTTYKRDALQPIADAIGLSVSEFSPLKKRNVILEGISDYYYFSGMNKLLRKEGDYFFIPGIGVRQINNLISMSIGYGLDWIAIIDDDPDEGGKDSKKKFDEIRDYVFDGNEEQTRERVHILKGITGIENMFTFEDLKLIDSRISKSATNDKVSAVGKRRKVLFSKLFFEKVKNGEINKDNISKTAITNFQKAFKFIGQHYPIG